MKKLIIISLLALSTQTFAVQTLSNSVAYTVAEAIYSAAIPVASTGLTTAATQENRKKAVEIQNDIQNYYQFNQISIMLQNHIELTQMLDNNLSIDEALDVISDATNIILMPL